jgi:hypothetical protein
VNSLRICLAVRSTTVGYAENVIGRRETVAACLLRICMQSAAANGKAFSAVFQSDDLAPGMQRTLVILVSISLGHVPALCSYGDQLVRWRH